MNVLAFTFRKSQIFHIFTFRKAHSIAATRMQHAPCECYRILKIKIEKVTEILVLRSAAGQLQVTSGSAGKFLWGSMVKFQKTCCN